MHNITKIYNILVHISYLCLCLNQNGIIPAFRLAQDSKVFLTFGFFELLLITFLSPIRRRFYIRDLVV